MAYCFALSRARFLTKIKRNSVHIFPCYCIKQLDSMLSCVCSVIDHRIRQNVVRTSVTLGYASCATFFVLTITEQTHGNMESSC